MSFEPGDIQRGLLIVFALVGVFECVRSIRLDRRSRYAVAVPLMWLLHVLVMYAVYYATNRFDYVDRSAWPSIVMLHGVVAMVVGLVYRRLKWNS